MSSSSTALTINSGETDAYEVTIRGMEARHSHTSFLLQDR